MTGKATATLHKIGEQAVVYEACFLPGVKAERTLHIKSTSGVHVYVDENDGDPVSIKLIHKPSAAIRYEAVPAGTPKALQDPYKLAVELLVIDKAIRELTKDARNAHATQSQINFRDQLINSETRQLTLAAAD